MEEVIEAIVAYFRHAAQGLEEKKQILYLLGPVGGGKSSLAEMLKSPHGEGALLRHQGLAGERVAPGAVQPGGGWPDPRGRLRHPPPLPEHHHEPLGGQAPARVRRATSPSSGWSSCYPSILAQVAMAKTEPGDENNQDISSLVGKIDIRKLETYSQNDPDAYSYSGGLCLANRGMLEFVEMFKAPIKVLHPLLTATQEGNYKGTEGFGAIPFDGLILAHSNEAEWTTFKNNRNNEAFLDRIYIVKVPYSLRVSDEVQDLPEAAGQLLASPQAPCAPDTLRMLAQFSVLSRLKEPENSSIYSKMRIYDGENLKDIDPKAKSYQEYRDYAGVDEGMTGLSTRFAFKILSKVFNLRPPGGGGQPGAPDVHPGTADRAGAVPARDRGAVPPLPQGIPVAPLRRVHRQGDPDRLPGELLGIRPEHLRPLRDLRRLLDPGPGVPRPQHRRAAGPGGPQRRAGKDREARGHLQPQGFPQRSGQLRAAGPGQARGQEPAPGPRTRSCGR